MIYKELCGERISMLGFGAMRLPVLADGEVDIPLTERMIDIAIDGGINYFDTAYPYHGGKSEIVVGRALSRYPRESYFLADKFPGHQTMSEYNPAEIFEDQLKKCGVDYFDFYLLHNVNERSIATYRDKRWGIVDYFLEQKRLGRIKHLGFSSHARVDGLREFLAEYGDKMEFCQIQLNYLDYKLQSAKEKVELIRSYGLGVWVMEPVRGGRLANLEPEYMAKLEALRPGVSAPEWAFRFLQSIPEGVVTLSGMSNMEQLEQNITTFDEEKVLTKQEWDTLLEIADDMIAKKTLPCTNCRYCTPYCAQELNIPQMIKFYNAQMYPENAGEVRAQVRALPDEQKPTACIACRACEDVCPQNIKISEMMAELAKRTC